jgi:alpha-tubulin suppressor-like RCC1 family protein
MIRRLGVFSAAGALLASAFLASGMSAAHADTFEDWGAVSAGGSHTCGIRHAGKLYCWGDDFFGEVGDGDGPDLTASAPRRIGTFEDWATVSAGGNHTCGVRTNGKLYCWGDDRADDDYFTGQIGDGDSDSTPVTTPRRIGTFEDWATVSAGGNHTCGVRTNGKLYCWGDDEDGRLGIGPTVGAVGAPARVGTFEDWSAVSAGGGHSCGVRHGGKLYCWGNADDGRLGAGAATGDANTPRRIGTFEDWAKVSAGGRHTCGARKNGKLYCWGDDDNGQVGDGVHLGSPDPALAPRRIGTFEDWANIAAGSQHSCAIRHLGKLYCWGMDASGQVGNGDSPALTASPRQV